MNTRTSLSQLVSILVLTAAACSSSPATSDAGAGSGGSTGGGTGGSSAGSGGAGSSGSGGVTAGSGGSSAGGSGGAAPTDGPSSMDLGAEAAPGDGGGADGGGPAAALNGFLFSIPCPTATTAGSCNIPDAMRAKMTTLTFGGDPNVTYKVTLHFCGPIEARPYTASMPAMLMCVDGTAVTSGFNPTYPKYEIRVASPAHSYFLNNRDLKDDLMKIDYSATIDIKGGSSITYVSDGGTNLEAFTSTIMNHNYTCPGVPGITQPFAGQFIYTTVESVTPS
jgi:hypothetical protein